MYFCLKATYRCLTGNTPLSQNLTYSEIVITTNKTDLKLSRLTSETCKLTSEIS